MKLCGVCKFLISASLVFAAGCAPQVVAPPDIAAESSERAAIKLFGAIVIRSSAGPARKARFVWTRFANENESPRDVADIKTPFGTTQARLEIDSDGMEILIGGQPADEKNAAPDLRAWLRSLPPPHSVGYWLAGEPDPAHPFRELFAANDSAAVRIHQHGWEAEYAERDEDGRPLRIVLRPLSPLPELPGALAEVRIIRRLSD